MASSLSTLLPTKANFTIWLHALSLAVTANLSHAMASGDKESALEALEFAAEVLLSWEKQAPHLSNVEWAGADNILAAAQALWEEWSEADWSMTAPLSCFFVLLFPKEGSPARGDKINMGDDGEMEMASLAQKAKAKASAAWALFQDKGTRRAKRAKRRASKQKAVNDLESPMPKVAKRARGRVSVNQNLSFQKTMADMAGSHATTRFTVDEGWEGTIGVRLNWMTRAVVKLAPYAERLAYWAAQGACQACEKMGVGSTCWYPTARHPCCWCTNRCAVCKDWDGGSARKPAPSKGRFRPRVPPILALTDVRGLPEEQWTSLAGQLMHARAEVARADRLSQLARLELADLEAVLDAGGANAKGDKEEEDREDGEAKMAGRYEEEEEAMEAERTGSEEEEVAMEAEKAGSEEEEMAMETEKAASEEEEVASGAEREG
ncbi:hypothetical protein C0991_003690 [Blastosporella zonata]|nr:hypothetical protein C0991_003690 [Blastosporella zonata]